MCVCVCVCVCVCMRACVCVYECVFVKHIAYIIFLFPSEEVTKVSMELALNQVNT